MRVMFVVLPEKTHLYYAVPVAWAVRTAGHDVCVATTPTLTDVVTRAGLTAAPVGSDPVIHEGMLRHKESQLSEFSDWNDIDPDRTTWENELLRYRVGVSSGFAGYNDSMVEGLVEFARQWQPDLVIWDALAYAAPIAARACGAAHGRIMFWADVWGRIRRTFLELKARQPEDRREDPMADWLGSWAEKFGCEFAEDMVTGQWTIDTLPESLGPDSGLRRIPVRYVPYNGPAVVHDWLREPPARTRVCLTLGITNPERFGGDYVPLGDILDSLGELDIEVVATLAPGSKRTVGTVPDNVRVVDSLALHTVLPSSAVLINHGGFGTYSTALVHGVPQLVVTTTIGDHTFRAQGLQDRGAGLFLRYDEVTGPRLRERLERLLAEPSFAQNARRLQAEALAHPSPNEIVPVLERLALSR
jgi:glycosyltransferase DesVII